MSDPIEQQEELSPTDDPVSNGGQEKTGFLSTPTKHEIVLSHTNLNVSHYTLQHCKNYKSKLHTIFLDC